MIVLSGKVKIVEYLRFASDGSQLAAGGPNGCQVWTHIGGELRAGASVDLHRAHEFAFLPRVRCFYAGKYRQFARIDLATLSRTQPEFRGEVMSFTTSPDEERLLLVEYHTGQFTLTCRATDAAHTLLWERLDPTWGARRQFLGTGQEVLVLNNSVYERCFAIQTTDTGEEVHRSPEMADAPNETVVSPDEARLACRTRQRIHVYPLRGTFSAPLATLVNDANRHFTGIAFHPSGRFLAATSNDATVRLYDTSSWEITRVFTWDIGRMRSIAFSADGTLAAAGSDKGKIVVWDVDL